LRLSDLYDQHVLVTRDSARVIADFLPITDSELADLSLDFRGVEAVTPSFFDELLSVLESKVGDHRRFKVTLVNFPTRMSSKYAAIARGRRVRIEELYPGEWEISRD
jgi:hypothetical protein